MKIHLQEEITLEKLWTSRTWRDLSERFFDVIKVILLTTVFDHVMDGYAAYQFIHGTPYKRMFPEKLNETYANSTNCVLTSFRVDANETITGYQYDCTEQVCISHNRVSKNGIKSKSIWMGP